MGSVIGVGTEIHLVNRLAQENLGKTVVSLDPLICPCSTMNRIDLPHLAWVLENLVDGEVVNQITVDADDGRRRPDRPATDARHRLTTMGDATHDGELGEAQLEAAVRRFSSGELGGEELTDRFRTGRWYAMLPSGAERAQRPGFLAVGTPGAGYVPVFTSLAALARYAATSPERHPDGVDWLSTTGDDLLSLLPAGYGLLVDAASDHAVYLEARAVRRRPVLVVRPRPEQSN